MLEESEQFLRRSLDLNPDNNPWAWSWLGLVLADQGSLEDAENHVRRALVGHEQNAVLIHNLTLVLVRHPDERADKLKEALNCCEQAEKFADFPFPTRPNLPFRSDRDCNRLAGARIPRHYLARLVAN